MGFFDRWDKPNRPKNSAITSKANAIVERLGKTKSVIAGIKGNGYYYDMVYEGYGLKIVKPDTNRYYAQGTYIDFKGERVLDDNTYIPGRWEEVLSELYQSIGAISTERKRVEDEKNRKDSIVKALLRITREGTIDIGSGIVIKGYKHMEGSHDQIDSGSRYYVYKDGELVLDAFCSVEYGGINPSCNKYVPGTWEDKVLKYSQYAQSNERQRQQQIRDNETNDIIKQLRKLRGE